jgi:hypothetical protein
MALRAILGCSTYRDDSALDFAAPRRFPARNAIPKPGQKTIPDHIRIPRQRYSLATVSVTATVLTFDAVIQSLPKGYTYRKGLRITSKTHKAALIFSTYICRLENFVCARMSGTDLYRESIAKPSTKYKTSKTMPARPQAVSK